MNEIIVPYIPVPPYTMNMRSRIFNLGDFAKRVFDILVASCGIILLAPFYIYIGLSIKRDSPGPIFYRGPRVGRGGKLFHILKFRTMYECPESYEGPRVTAQDDPRVTPLGKWLRDTKRNELPQLWNVLKGEMSLVGPRPEDPQIVASWPEQVRQEVLSVRPGITSPASVLYRNEESMLHDGQVMDSYLDKILPSKLRLDQLYVRHHSIWSDLDILFWTLLVLVPRVSGYLPAEERLFVGPVSQLMRHHVSWLLVDTAVTFLALGLTGLFWRSLGPLNVGWLPAAVLALGFALLFSLANAALGVNRIDWSRAAASDVLDLLPGAALATVIALFFNYFFPASLLGIPQTEQVMPWGTRALLPPGLIIMASALSFFGFAAVRYRGRLITGFANRWLTWRGPAVATRERVLIVGGGESGQFAVWVLNTGRYASSFQVVGFVDDDLYKQGTRIRGINVLGRRTEIPQLVDKYDIGIIVFAIHNILPSERQALLEICGTTRAKVLLFPNIQAALTDISRNGNGKRHPATQEAGPAARQEVVTSESKFYPANAALLNLDEWLTDLEEHARSGEIEDLLAQIHKLRQQVGEDTTHPLTSNPTEKKS